MASGVQGGDSAPALARATITTKLIINATFIVKAGVELGGVETLAVALEVLREYRELLCIMQRPDIRRYHMYHL
jgi:hypothetical protein